jgi:methanogenic corrinoid protein MtbC1
MYYSKITEIENNSSSEPLNQLERALVSYDKQLAISSVMQLLEKKVEPQIIISTMTAIMRLIGEAYENDELFLPDLIGASETMASAMPLVENEIMKTGGKISSLGVIVLGTVLGDIHSIGKQMVGTMLTAEGFTLYDIGIDISAQKFIESVKSHNADILAMSALLTTTAYEQKKVISLLEEEGLREKVKVMVGGGAVTEEFAINIGADGYDPTAPGAAKLARKLLNK